MRSCSRPLAKHLSSLDATVCGCGAKAGHDQENLLGIIKPSVDNRPTITLPANRGGSPRTGKAACLIFKPPHRAPTRNAAAISGATNVIEVAAPVKKARQFPQRELKCLIDAAGPSECRSLARKTRKLLVPDVQVADTIAAANAGAIRQRITLVAGN